MSMVIKTLIIWRFAPKVWQVLLGLMFWYNSYISTKGDSTCGQRALYPLGMTGIPIFNVNNNCATGSTALFMASQFISGGIVDCVLALGFEKMQKGSLPSKVYKSH